MFGRNSFFIYCAGCGVLFDKNKGSWREPLSATIACSGDCHGKLQKMYCASLVCKDREKVFSVKDTG